MQPLRTSTVQFRRLSSVVAVDDGVVEVLLRWLAGAFGGAARVVAS